MAELKAKSPCTSGTYQTFIHPSLSKSSHVFIRWDSVKQPLQRLYDGPYKVLHRTDKYFTIDTNGTHDTISIDRLKAAYFDSPNSVLADGDSSTSTPTVTPIPSFSSHTTPSGTTR